MPGNFPGATPILTFHKVDPRFEWGVTRIPPARFRSVLEFLRDRGYVSVSLSDLSSPAEALPEPRVVLTFDDSYESVYTQAFPMMETLGFRGRVFVLTGYVGKMNTWDVNLGGLRFLHLSWKQIVALRDAGFEIGSHTVTHPDLTRIGERRLFLEVERSKKTLEDRLGIPIRSISFPFGRVNEAVLRACRRAGYTQAVGCHVPRAVQNFEEMVVFGRKACYLFDTKRNLEAKLQRTVWSPFESMRLRAINACSRGSSWVKPPGRMDIDDS